MAQCSFLKSTEAVNLSRNNTVIWTEICELQAAILAAIDSNQRSVIVSEGTPFTFLGAIETATLDPSPGGSGYSIDAATATINANGTGGTGATVSLNVPSTGVISNSDFTITNGGSGYNPVSASASVGVLYELDPASQDETLYNGTVPNGDFDGGNFYAVGDIITLTEASTVTVDVINSAGGLARTIYNQTEADFDDAIAATENGTFAGGNANPFTGYLAGQTITLNDGTQILVENVDANGDVTEFTLTRTSQTAIPVDSTLYQVSVDSGQGQGFTLTTDGNNETLVGIVTEFTVSASSVPFRYPATLSQSGITAGANTTAIGEGFTLEPNTNNASPTTTGSGAILTPIVTNGVITSVVINNGGTLYLGQEPIVFSHPSGTNASAYVSAVSVTGAVTGITLVSGGSGYETATPTITISHSRGFGFEGTVQTSGGVVTGITVQDGGSQYADVYPYVTISDATGSGAEINVTGVSAGAITSIQLVRGGYNYSDTPSVLIFNFDGTANNSANIDLTTEADTFNNPNDPNDYYLVLEGQSSDRVVADQLQYVLDYFTALGYNIRAQVNPATNNTIQWQIIW